jgi:hypothetical protein
MKTRHLVAAAALAMPLAATAAHADTAPPAAWQDTIKIGAQLDAGITGNFASPSNNENFGSLYTDRANAPILNQALLSIGRPVDPKATDYDFGFKLQGIYGTDGRYTHDAYFLDHFSKGQMQPGILEASFDAFTPWLTEGGINWQVGMFPALLGFETTDASTNPFYSHSYLFNFAVPVKHTGFNAIVHATDALDLYAGVDVGNQTIIGYDNNHAESFLAGLKYTFNDNLNILALTHIGPENAQKVYAGTRLNADNYNRFYNDAVVSYKANDKLTLTTELNYSQDDGDLINGKIKSAEAYGVAQYAAYAFSDTVTANLRAEVFSDTRGFFVASFNNGQAAVLALEGNPAANLTSFSGNSTYGELTAGVTFKPTLPDSMSAITMLVRPEFRVDQIIGGPARFNNGKDKTAVTAALDVVLTY